MEYKIYLDYTMDLLSRLKIPSYIIEPPFTWKDEYDGELRKTIWNEKTFGERKDNFNSFMDYYNKDNVIFLIHDSFSCEYIHIKLPDSDNIFIAGPFSFERFTDGRILELCEINGIPERLTEFMQLYYAALPVFTDARCIEGIINCLCSKLWDNYTLEKNVYLIMMQQNQYTMKKLRHRHVSQYRYLKIDTKKKCALWNTSHMVITSPLKLLTTLIPLVLNHDYPIPYVTERTL